MHGVLNVYAPYLKFDPYHFMQNEHIDAHFQSELDHIHFKKRDHIYLDHHLHYASSLMYDIIYICARVWFVQITVFRRKNQF